MDTFKRPASGLTGQEIAGELFLSLNTVKWYNRQIYGKPLVRSRMRAIAHARETGLLDGGDLPAEPTAVRTSTLLAHTTSFRRGSGA